MNNPPFLYRGPQTPDRLPPVARVLTVDLNDEAVAYPYDILQDKHAINDVVGGQDIVALWQAGTSSALDQAAVAGGRGVGTSNAYSRQLDGQTLTLECDGARLIDQNTGVSGMYWAARSAAHSRAKR